MSQSTNRHIQGVSPVVAVILMVAVTVLLAMVVGTFVFDLAGNIGDTEQSSATITTKETTNAAGQSVLEIRVLSLNGADGVSYFIQGDRPRRVGTEAGDSVQLVLGQDIPKGSRVAVLAEHEGQYQQINSYENEDVAYEVNNVQHASSILDGTSIDGPRGVYKDGNHLYVSNDERPALTVVDVSDPNNPTVVGEAYDTNLLDGGANVYARGNYAYVAARHSDSLTVVDVSDPTNPTIAGHLSTSPEMDAVHDITVQGDYAYLAAFAGSTSQDGLAIVNISDPTAPTLKGWATDSTLGGAHGVAVRDDVAYVATARYDSVTTVDISDKSNPSVLGSVQHSTELDGSNRIALTDGYAYVANIRDNSMRIVDVSDPANPALAGEFSNVPNDRGVDVQGNYAYTTSADTSTFYVVDVSDPANPTESDSFTDSTVLNDVRAVHVEGNYAYVVSRASDKIVVLYLDGDQIIAP